MSKLYVIAYFSLFPKAFKTLSYYDHMTWTREEGLVVELCMDSGDKSGVGYPRDVEQLVAGYG